jgi:hypothetical protein
MALPLRAALQSAGRFMVKNPLSALTMARHALSLRVAVPLDALRWFIANTPPGKQAPTDVTIMAKPPAIGIGATIDLMGTRVRASASIFVDELRVGTDELRVSLRLTEVQMKVLGESNTPVAALLKSGALDLSKPGKLVNFMPKKPDVLVDAHDDTIVLDLLKNPKIAANDKVRRILSTLTPVVNVSALKTDGDFLILALRATPLGIPRAFNAARALTS